MDKAEQTLVEDELGSFRLTDALRLIVDRRSIGSVLDRIAREVSDGVGFDFAAIILPDGRDGSWSRVRLGGAHNLPAAYSRRLAALYEDPDETRESPTQAAARAGRIAVHSDVLSDETFEPWRQLAVEFGYGSLLSVPLTMRGTSIGVLNGYGRGPRAFEPAEIAAVQSMADQAAVAVETATMVQRQQESIDALRGLNDELERQRSIEVRSQQIHASLIEASLTGGGVASVAEALSVAIGAPALFAGADGTIEGAFPVAEVAGGLTDAAAAAIRASVAPGSRTGTPSTVVPGDPALVIAHARIGSERVGHVVVAARDGADGELVRRAAEQAAVVVALETMRGRAERATEERLGVDFLLDAVTGRGGDPAREEERARFHGIVPTDPYRLLVVELDGWDALLRATHPSESEADALLQRLLGQVRSTARAHDRGALIGAIGDRVTIALPASGTSDADFERLFDQMHANVRGVAPTVSLHAGLGPATTSLTDFPVSYSAATRALTVLQRLKGRNRLLTSDQLGVAGLLMETSDPLQLRAMARRVLGPLLDRDARNEGALVPTLFAYLDSGGDHHRAAKALYVHVNTVRYRMRRIEELAGVSLLNPQDLLELTIAQLVHRLQ